MTDEGHDLLQLIYVEARLLDALARLAKPWSAFFGA
jgi:hypothetical protein